MTIRIAIALVAVLVVAGCDLLLPSGNGAGLDGEWRLTGGMRGGDPLPMPDGAPITMSIDGTQVGGRAACNTYGGELTIEDDRIIVGAMTMTEMGCDPAIMEAEAAYIEALGDVTHWARTGGTLTLSGEGVELTYETVPPEADAALVGTSWRLDGLVDGDAVSSTIGDPATLELRDDGTLSGTTGCRTFEARYEVDGDAVSVAELVNDDRACPDLAVQDEHVLSVVGEGFSYAIEGRQLSLHDGGLGLVYLADEG